MSKDSQMHLIIIIEHISSCHQQKHITHGEKKKAYYKVLLLLLDGWLVGKVPICCIYAVDDGSGNMCMNEVGKRVIM